MCRKHFSAFASILINRNRRILLCSSCLTRQVTMNIVEKCAAFLIAHCLVLNLFLLGGGPCLAKSALCECEQQLTMNATPLMWLATQRRMQSGACRAVVCQGAARGGRRSPESESGCMNQTWWIHTTGCTTGCTTRKMSLYTIVYTDIFLLVVQPVVWIHHVWFMQPDIQLFHRVYSRDRTGTVPGLVPDRNKVDSVRSRNIFCSGVGPC